MCYSSTFCLKSSKILDTIRCKKMQKEEEENYLKKMLLSTCFEINHTYNREFY